RLNVVRLRGVEGTEQGIEIDIRDSIAGAHSLNGVEAPVNAEEDAASGAFRGCLAEARVVPRLDVPNKVHDEVRYLLVNVARHAVQFIGDEVEGDLHVDVI